MKIRDKTDLLVKSIKKKDTYLGKRLIRAVYENLLRLFYKFYRSKGHSIFEEEWDFLILLDACRYDLFKKFNTIKGKLKKEISLGSDTEEWFRKNFQEDRKDIIYVASNPKFFIERKTNKALYTKISSSFFRVEDVWKYGWAEKLDTVPPKEVTKATIKLMKKYPNKKMIIHYLQPHLPYIGKTRITYPQKKKKDMWLSVAQIHDQVCFNNFDTNLIKQAYQDNLKLVLKEAENLVKKLHGRIIITSDHGEAFGEKNLFFHPQGIYIKELVEVPWLVIEKKRLRKRLASKKIKSIVSEIKI